ncbi:zinc-finger domain-containing protein [Bacillus niameyensis]|uniref:zinc-finger domain-containing protein n=1 Tax=Bacillus niameyensis TaxID=1522308 RepID=UPI0009FDEA58|nr:zinc-finger domain-containing protein [Bacillus niameyensis]
MGENCLIVLDGYNLYCEDCFLHEHLKKEYSKTYAHRFCIKQCTVGQELKAMGEGLLISKN